MAIDLPAKPWAEGDEFTHPTSGNVYVYDGKGRWVLQSSRSDQWVNSDGDTMSGLLVLSGDPAADLGAATKQYVDGLAGEQSTALRHIIANLGYLSWDFELQDSAGNPEPTPPTDPDQITYTSQSNPLLGVRVVITRAGGLVVSQQILYSVDGGANWLPAGNATNPNATLTFVYSTQVGYEDSIIGGTWT